jgi:hypothetical protein
VPQDALASPDSEAGKGALLLQLWGFWVCLDVDHWHQRLARAVRVVRAVQGHSNAPLSPAWIPQVQEELWGLKRIAAPHYAVEPITIKRLPRDGLWHTSLKSRANIATMLRLTFVLLFLSLVLPAGG